MQKDNFLKFCFAFLFTVTLLSCDESGIKDFGTMPTPEKQLTVTPGELSQYGNEWITIENLPFEFEKNDEPIVLINDINCIFLKVTSSDSLECYVQGSPDSGKAHLSIYNGKEELHRYGLFEIRPVYNRIYRNFWAIGGSVLAGEQNRSLLWSSQLNSPASLVAKKFGAYFPMPLIKEPGVTSYLSLNDLDPQYGTYGSEAESVETGQYLEDFDKLRSMRLDDYILPQNLSVPSLEDISGLYASSFIEERTEMFNQLVRYRSSSQNGVAPIVDIINSSPTFILLGDELFKSILDSKLDRLDVYKQQVTKLLQRFTSNLVNLDEFPHIVIMNLLPPSIYPGMEYNTFTRYKSILINNTIQKFADDFNFDYGENKISVVDQYGMFLDIMRAENSISLFGEEISVEKGTNLETNLIFSDADQNRHTLGFDFLEGLFSLDKRSLTNSGTTLIANQILKTLNENINESPVSYYSLKTAVLNDPLSSTQMDFKIDSMLFTPREYFADKNGFSALSTDELCAIEWKTYESREKCPAIIQSVNGDSFVYGNSDSVQLPIRIRNSDYDILTNIRIIAKATYGTLAKEILDTDTSGQATIIYLPSKEHDYDYIDIISGSTSRRIYAYKTDD